VRRASRVGIGGLRSSTICRNPQRSSSASPCNECGH